MAIKPSVPEIITVNSEALQTQIRDLLPSQSGFGSELQASNVITPIIDLTAAAEGSSLPVSLQQAIAFGSQTSVTAQNNTQTAANSPGFYRIFGVASLFAANNAPTVSIDLTDGLSTKNLFNFLINSNSATPLVTSQTYDFIVFLAAGESLSITSNNSRAIGQLTYRQIATGDGTLVQPSGFPL